MSVGAIIALLTALIGFISKVWPDKATPEQQAKQNVAQAQRDSDEFEKTKDTTHLGDFH